MSSKKLPAIQFYVGDWLRDSISSCSLAAQGLWLRMMMVMHDSERYGFLQINGKAMTDAQVAAKCGCSVGEYESLLCELFSIGVPSRTPRNVIFCRRMVRDQHRRALTKHRVKKFRSRINGEFTSKTVSGNASVTQHVTQMKHRASSSVSSSVSTSIKRPMAPPENGAEPTDLQKVVLSWKVITGFDENDKEWDRAHFSRCAATAKKLTEFLGSWGDAIDCMEDVHRHLTSRGLTCTIETCLKHSAEWKMTKSNGGRYGEDNRRRAGAQA